MTLPEHIILFDGVCNFCDNTVQWIIKRDTGKKFYFASLQSETGQELLRQHQIDTEQVDSVVYVKKDTAYIKSTAALHILRDLGTVWSVLYVLIVFPAFIRDLFYDQFARRRYLLFGKKEECMIPTKEQRSRFL